MTKKITIFKLLICLLALNINEMHAQTTKMRASYCPYTAQSMGEFLGADSVITANHYEFLLEDANQNYSNSFVNSSGYPYLALYLVPGILYSTTYTVTVRWSADSPTVTPTNWSAYGPACQITSPGASITQLDNISCNASIPSYGTPISADPVSGALEYEFTVYNTSLSYTQTVLKSSFFGPNAFNNNFSLALLNSLTPSTTYSVFVRVNVLGALDIPGPECTITTPGAPTTTLEPLSCGSSPASYSDLLFAEAVDGATDYQYQLSNSLLSFTTTFTKSNNNFILSQFNGLLDNTTYDVAVRVSTDGGTSFGPYGASCLVTTPGAPTTQLSGGSCGSNPANYEQLLFADEINGATGYNFRLYNTALNYTNTVSQLNPNFNLSRFNNTGLLASQIYTVEVSVEFNGTFGAYGPPCTVVVPADPTTQLEIGSCGITATSYTNQLIKADIVSGATNYDFLITNVASSYSSVVSKTNNNFILDQATTPLAFSTTYTVEVRISYDNGTTFGLYGTPCTITTPGSYMRLASSNSSSPGIDESATVNIASEFLIGNQLKEAIVFPNPTEDIFTMSLSVEQDENTIFLKVMDMTGRILANRAIHPGEKDSVEFGNEFAPGIYNVVLSQGDAIKTIRLIKN